MRMSVVFGRTLDLPGGAEDASKGRTQERRDLAHEETPWPAVSASLVQASITLVFYPQGAAWAAVSTAVFADWMNTSQLVV